LPRAVETYLDRLRLPSGRREALRAELAARGCSTATDALRELQMLLAEAHTAPQGDYTLASVQARLKLAYGTPHTPYGPVIAEDAQHRERLFTMPPLNRSSMSPRAWMKRRRHSPVADSPDPRGRWHMAGVRRRLFLLSLLLAQTYLATYSMALVLPYHGRQPLEVGILMLFAILFAWVTGGFWTAVAGFFTLNAGHDAYAISRTARPDAPIDPEARTAIIMPVANENVARVFAGLRATYESLARTGNLERFDFFILSDSSDPDLRVAETQAWMDFCVRLSAFGRVFYRWRQHRIKRKSGNVADFCRRWGRSYRYMVILDADSVMSGDCLCMLVRIAEANPNAGIIQTAPRAAGRDTLYARVQQFATRVYGPLFTAGLHYWQLGESHYWGHNAIIRVAPFMKHCALGRLPGRGALAGEILSHDFVEAALMRRAGWAVWIAYDLPGSYEEMPPNLIDELKRDRRWCQGNLMNFRLFSMKGLHVAHRAVFMSGVMAYFSALLWFLFLVLSTALLAVHELTVPEYFLEPYQLFPIWPEWRPQWAIWLFTATASILLIPKLLSVLLVAKRGASRFGNTFRATVSVLGEIALSTLLAPIRMLFHTRFVVTSIIGWTVRWKSPPREDAETTWREAIRHHGLQTLLGVAWAGGVYWLNPAFVWWLLPIAGALIVSIPVSVYTSRVSLGRHLRRAKYFLIPEEFSPPTEIRSTRRYWKLAQPDRDFIDAVTDPVVNAVACAFGAARREPTEAALRQRGALVERALWRGPEDLERSDKMILLNDPVALSQLHFKVWTSSRAHPDWRPDAAPQAGDARSEYHAPLHAVRTSTLARKGVDDEEAEAGQERREGQGSQEGRA
jgi:membrane glycosyltransferase